MYVCMYVPKNTDKYLSTKNHFIAYIFIKRNKYKSLKEWN